MDDETILGDTARSDMENEEEEDDDEAIPLSLGSDIRLDEELSSLSLPFFLRSFLSSSGSECSESDEDDEDEDEEESVASIDDDDDDDDDGC